MILPPPVFDLGLSDARLADVGRIILLWGQAEFHVGNALCSFADVPDTMRDDLVNNLAFGRKVDLLKKHCPAPRLQPLIEELKFVASTWKQQRDTLAHGSSSQAYKRGANGEDLTSIIAVAKPRDVGEEDLAVAVERAGYAAMLAMELNYYTAGGQAWPFMRPSRPG